MANRKPDEPPKGPAPWMATFSDLMNLLLCFFVLLFSMSTVDAQKFELIAASFSNNFSVLSGGAKAIGEGMLISNGVSQLDNLSEFLSTIGATAESDAEYQEQMAELEEAQLERSEQMAELIEEALQEGQLADEVDVDFNSQYVSLNLNGALLFDSGKASLREEAEPLLGQIGRMLETYAQSVIEIEGHTDNVPIHNSAFANNDELSSFRALAVFEYFVGNTNLNPANIKHSGRGEYVPVADNATPEGRQKNRRVEIKIYHNLSTQY